MLPFAVVKFICGNISGTMRILFDTCSQVTVISDSFVRKWHLMTSSQPYQSFEGIGGASTKVNRVYNIDLISRLKQFSINVDALVLPANTIPYSLTGVPVSKFSRKLCEFVCNVRVIL